MHKQLLVVVLLLAGPALGGSFNSAIGAGVTSAGQLADITVQGDPLDTWKYLRYLNDVGGAFYGPMPQSTYIMEHCTNITEVGGLGMTGTETEIAFYTHDTNAVFPFSGATQCWCVGGAGCTNFTGPSVEVEECDSSGQNCSKGVSPCPTCDLDRVGYCDENGISITGAGTIDSGNSVRVSVTSVNPTVSDVVVCNRIVYSGDPI